MASGLEFNIFVNVQKRCPRKKRKVVITAVYVRNTPTVIHFTKISRIALIQYLFWCIIVHLLQLNDKVLLFLQKTNSNHYLEYRLCNILYALEIRKPSHDVYAGR